MNLVVLFLSIIDCSVESYQRDSSGLLRSHETGNKEKMARGVVESEGKAEIEVKVRRSEVR